MEQTTPRPPKTDTGAAAEAKTSTTAAAGVSSGTSGAKAKPPYRELGTPTLRDRAATSKEGGHNTNSRGAGGCRLSGTSLERLTTTRRVSRTTEILRPPPLVLHTAENDSSSGQSTAVATTEGATVATAESGRPRVQSLSITSTEGPQPAVTTPCWTSSLHEILASSLPTAAAAVTRFATQSNNNSRSRTVTGSGAREPCSASRVCPMEKAMQHTLVHVLQRERVRALITRALHLWHLHCALWRHGRRHGDRETAAGVEGQRPMPSATRRAFHRSCHASDPHLCSVQTRGLPAAPAAVPTLTVGPIESSSPSASRQAWAPLGGMDIGRRCGGIATNEGNVYVDADDEEELHDVDDDAEVPRHTERQRRQQHHRGRRCTDGNSSLSDADVYVDSAYDRVDKPGTSARPLAPASRSSVIPVIGAASRVTSIVPPHSALSNASQSQSLARDMSFTSVRWSMSCPFQTLLQPQRQDELCSASFPQTSVTVSVPGSSTVDSAGVSPSGAAAAAAERRKRMVQHLLSGKSPRNASPHQRFNNWLSSSVGGGTTSSLDDSCSRPQSCAQSDREPSAAEGGPPLCLRRPRSSTGSGAGLIASDSEDHSISSLINTSHVPQMDGSNSPSGAWGPLRDSDSTHSDSTSPIPMVTVTTAPQLLTREAEDRLALQATEERRRLRLQHAMSAVMDQLMMTALRHRSVERGLHPSLRTSTAPSPVLLDRNDSRDMDFLCVGATETHNEGTTWGSAGAIEPEVSACPPWTSSPSPAQRHLQRSGRTQGEAGCLCDATAEHAERSVSRDSAKAVDSGASLSKRSSDTFELISQWGAHVLEVVTITTDNPSDVVPATSTVPTSHPPRALA